MQAKKEEENQVPEDMIEYLVEKVNNVQTNSKAVKVLELVQQIDDKVIIFTEYRATQLYLQWYLKQHGITSVPFRGGFKRGKKDWMKDLFKNHAQVLIATEAGGEGINLQFCNHIINYDLPWNPMRLEQRIGRIHRLGQEKDVYIYNLATKGTIEEHILKLLYEKINLFERVVGDLDEILSRIDIQNIEDHIQDILVNSKSNGEMRIKMDNLTSIINFAEQIPGSVIIMQQQEIHNFLDRYFTATNCEVLEQSNGHMKVQLTIDLDKELMNRPFYWHYLEKTGGVPNPMQLTFITDQNNVSDTLKGEMIHFGSPRLHQIFQSTIKFGKFIRLFENRSTNRKYEHPIATMDWDKRKNILPM